MDLIQQVGTQVSIQMTERLVEQQHCWTRCEGPGKRHTLLLPTRELMWITPGQRAESHHLQHLSQALYPFLRTEMA